MDEYKDQYEEIGRKNAILVKDVKLALINRMKKRI
jgi:hypothetical protein